jgi:hypothetical protein
MCKWKLLPSLCMTYRVVHFKANAYVTAPRIAPARVQRVLEEEALLLQLVVVNTAADDQLLSSSQALA